jgi:hypothetical protein
VVGVGAHECAHLLHKLLDVFAEYCVAFVVLAHEHPKQPKLVNLHAVCMNDDQDVCFDWAQMVAMHASVFPSNKVVRRCVVAVADVYKHDSAAIS